MATQSGAAAAAILSEFPNVSMIRQTAQVAMMHTRIRDRSTERTDFVFYADRLIRLIVEDGLAMLPHVSSVVLTPTGARYEGSTPAAGICGVSIMRAGESMEKALRDTCRGVRIGKILIQRNEASSTKEPDSRYNYCKVPHDIANRWVLLMDPMLATGGSAIRAASTLIQSYKVKEENIVFLNVVSCPEGVRNLTAAFPKIRIVTSAIDDCLNEHMYIVPGLGDFGDRYFGTDFKPVESATDD